MSSGIVLHCTGSVRLCSLNEQAFATPVLLLRAEILRRIEPSGALDRIRTSQTRVLTSLLANQRLDRLVEQEAIDWGAACGRRSSRTVSRRAAVARERDHRGAAARYRSRDQAAPGGFEGPDREDPRSEVSASVTRPGDSGSRNAPRPRRNGYLLAGLRHLRSGAAAVDRARQCRNVRGSGAWLTRPHAAQACP